MFLVIPPKLHKLFITELESTLMDGHVGNLMDIFIGNDDQLLQFLLLYMRMHSLSSYSGLVQVQTAIIGQYRTYFPSIYDVHGAKLTCVFCCKIMEERKF